ncbi:MAG: threo-3-hydroxy-L-aspartate ammonia-lyase [Nitriliruptorales bacterium]
MIDYDDVCAAADRLRGVAHRTPVVTSRTLDAWTGATVVCKAENLQRAGSFKIRGAYNLLVSLSEADRERGVVAYSSGNHGQAVALAARLLGTAAVIVMPEDAPRAKRAATENYGAEIVTYDRASEDREATARAIADERGLTVVPPYDHPAVMAGQGTAALELIEDVGPIDVLVVPVGGGGLISGSAIAASRRCPGVRIVGVEPAAADDTRRSLAAGERVSISRPDTIADGLQARSPGVLTFPVIRRLVDAVVTVTDDEIVEAMVFFLDRTKLVVEPSGVCAAAALLTGRLAIEGKRVGLLLSGGNVGADRLAALLSSRRLTESSTAVFPPQDRDAARDRA